MCKHKYSVQFTVHSCTHTLAAADKHNIVCLASNVIFDDVLFLRSHSVNVSDTYELGGERKLSAVLLSRAENENEIERHARERRRKREKKCSVILDGSRREVLLHLR